MDNVNQRLLKTVLVAAIPGLPPSLQGKVLNVADGGLSAALEDGQTFSVVEKVFVKKWMASVAPAISSVL